MPPGNVGGTLPELDPQTYIVTIIDRGENASQAAYAIATPTNDNTTTTMCMPGEFVYFTDAPITRSCMPCRPGTFANRSSAVNHACPNKCEPGYTTQYGATSRADCEPAYMLMDGPNCSGAIDTNGNGWSNRGFQHITTAEECAAAAQGIHEQGDGRIDVTAVSITERCTDTNLQTNTSDDHAAEEVCQLIKHLQGGVCEVDALFTNADIAGGKNTIRMNCSKTCSSCGADGGLFCRGGNAPDAAPVGFCVLETNTRGEQRLSFYDGCSAAYFDGDGYNAICKVLECSPQEQVQGGGSTTPSATTSPQDANAVCEPNAAQFSTWCREKEFKYTIYYGFNILFVALVYSYLVYHWSTNSGSYDVRENQSGIQLDGPGKSPVRLWWQKKGKKPWDEFWIATYTIFKLVDLLSDWAFCLIAIMLGRSSTVLYIHAARTHFVHSFCLAAMHHLISSCTHGLHSQLLLLAP